MRLHGIDEYKYEELIGNWNLIWKYILWMKVWVSRNFIDLVRRFYGNIYLVYRLM